MSRHVLVGSLGTERPELDLAFAHAMVLRASRGEIDEVIRVYRPHRSMLVFGRSDVRQPGFRRAVDACYAAGFVPAIRASGGHAVAYTARSVVIDHVKHQVDATAGLEHRFRAMGATFADVLREYDVDARVGAVSGEYCSGAHSVNARGEVKLVGTAQRLVRNAWLFSSLIVIDDAEDIRRLLAEVYEALALPFSGSSVGSVAQEAPLATAVDVEDAIVDAMAVDASTAAVARDSRSITLARDLLSQHALVRDEP